MKKLISILLCCVLIITSSACQKAEVPLTATELLELGEKFLLELDYEQALVQFLKVIEIEPMNARAYLAAAEVYINIGDVDKAIAVLVQGADVVDDSGIAARLERLTVTESFEPEVKPEPRFRQDPKTVQGYVPELEPEPVLQEIIIESLPKTDYLIGEPLDLTDLVLKAIYDNGGEFEIEDYTTEPSTGDILTADNANVLITYINNTVVEKAEFELTVVVPSLPKTTHSSANINVNALESKINAMLLKPLVAEPSSDIYRELDKVIKPEMSNYQKLRTAFTWTTDYIAGFGPYGLTCFDSSFLLRDVIEYVGLRAVQLAGDTRSSNGGWTGHIWVGVEIDGQMYCFDADLPKYGVSVDRCFGISSSEALIYRNISIFNEWDDEFRANYYQAP